MKCVVTGGAGFIGRHLCAALQTAGHEVVVMDLRQSINREGWAIAQYWDDLSRIVPNLTGYEWVFHLAGLAAVQPSLERPAEYMRVNVQGTVNVLEAARQAGVRRVIYAASGTVYGFAPPQQPTSETCPPDPGTPYALSKWLGEEVCRHWTQVYGVPTVALRLFNPYGPGMSEANRMGEWLAMRRAGQVITVSGSPNQARDYCYIDDVVRAFILAAESDVTGEAINIGSGQPVKIRDLVAMLGPHEFEDAGWQAPGTWADISKAKRVLGWAPTVAFEDGMRRVLKAEDSTINPAGTQA